MRRHFHSSRKKPDHVAYIDEITQLLPVAMYLDSPRAAEAITEDRNYACIRRFRVLPRSVNIEKTQTGRRDTVNDAADVCMQFASKLIGAIGSQWPGERAFL